MGWPPQLLKCAMELSRHRRLQPPLADRRHHLLMLCIRVSRYIAEPAPQCGTVASLVAFRWQSF